MKILWLAAFAGLLGQNFEVASIRPQASDDSRLFVRPPNRGQFTATGTVAKLLMMLAYGVQDSQIIGGPSWVATEKWDIQAKSGNDQHSVEETRIMLQHLLADRFSLQLHRSTAQLPVYALTVGKGGPKFKASRGTATNIQVGPNSIFMEAGTVGRLTELLATALGRPVIDRTGLTGVYDLSIQWDDAPVRDGGLPGTADSQAKVAGVPSNGERGSIFTAVPDQLGLRLEAQKAPVDVLVIDQIERPSPN
jgi:uncharacterized protein (TIGR03435 family)